jgi:hypothetical protein
LARAYDHVVVDAGAVAEAVMERFAQLTPRALLVAANATSPTTAMARDKLLAAGFADVTVLVGRPQTAAAA